MTSSLRESLGRILAWVGKKAPATLEGLNPPASMTEIAALEFQLGMRLPDFFMEFLRIHNGESSENMLALLGDGNQLLSCKEIRKQYALDQQTGKSVHQPEISTVAFWKERVSSMVISVKGAVKPLVLHPKWIPITRMNNNIVRYIDLDPAPTGASGQIIEVDMKSRSYEVLANSFEELLSNYADQLEAGLFEAEENGNIFRDGGKDVMNWGVPAWLRKA